MLDSAVCRLCMCDQQMKKERETEIDRENQLLLKRLETICNGHGQIDNWNHYKHHRFTLSY